MAKPTTRNRLLVAVSVAQMATNVTGLAVALRRRHPYDVFWMHGQAETVARDAILKGTALSAPVSNLLAQAAMTVLVARRPSQGAARALAGLGALQGPGYLGEQPDCGRHHSGLPHVEGAVLPEAHPTPVAHRCLAATSLYKICSSSGGSGYNRGRRHGRQEPPVDGG